MKLLKNPTFSLIILFFYAVPFWFHFPSPLVYLQFVLGLIIGFFIILIDRVTHAFYLYPESEFNQIIHQLIKQKKYFRALTILLTADDLQPKLLTRSALFLGVYIALTIFVLTSTGSTLGIGLVFGLGLRLTLDMFRYRPDPTAFHEQYLWQIKRKFSHSEVNQIVWGFSAFFVVISLLVIF
jgi:hypothetical protein